MGEISAAYVEIRKRNRITGVAKRSGDRLVSTESFYIVPSAKSSLIQDLFSKASFEAKAGTESDRYGGYDYLRRDL